MQNEWGHLQGFPGWGESAPGGLRVSAEGSQDWQPDHLESCSPPPPPKDLLRNLARDHSRPMEQILVVSISSLRP